MSLYTDIAADLVTAGIATQEQADLFIAEGHKRGYESFKLRMKNHKAEQDRQLARSCSRKLWDWWRS